MGSAHNRIKLLACQISYCVNNVSDRVNTAIACNEYDHFFCIFCSKMKLIHYNINSLRNIIAVILDLFT